MDYLSLSIVLIFGAFFGILAKFAKQPLLVGYLFAGAVLSLFGFVDLSSIEQLGKIGITLLLFLVGLEMNLTDIHKIGKVAIITGLGQIIFTSFFGFLLSFFLGYSPLVSLYIAVSLTFSSTIIIVKLLSEKGDINSLYGKISIGFLLIQDLVAVLILMMLSGLKSGNLSFVSIILLFAKGAILFYLTWILSKSFLPKIFEKVVGHGSELLFIVSIAWAMGVSALTGGPMGFSFEIGGFLAGLSLSNISENLGIANRTRSLRDFFLTLFFMSLGAMIAQGGISGNFVSILLFSLFVLLGNPLIVMSILGFLGYKKRTSFLSSVTVAQISEFSFILMAMGFGLGHVDKSAVSTIVYVGAITMTLSTYLISQSDRIYPKIKDFLSLFERKHVKESVFSEISEDYFDHIVIIGCDRTGRRILPYLKNHKYKIVILDHNPEVFKSLSSEGLNVILGDVTDREIVSLLNFSKAKIIISTVSSYLENSEILHEVNSLHKKPTTIVMAQTKKDAISLYEKGADFVLVPEVLAGEFLRHVFVNHGLSVERFKKMGKGHFNRLLYAKN